MVVGVLALMGVDVLGLDWIVDGGRAWVWWVAVVGANLDVEKAIFFGEGF